MTPSLFFRNAGMLTITDFINILRHHYKSPIVSLIEALVETLRIYTAMLSIVCPTKVYTGLCVSLLEVYYTSLVC
jgi:hypothetical protein